MYICQHLLSIFLGLPQITMQTTPQPCWRSGSQSCRNITITWSGDRWTCQCKSKRTAVLAITSHSLWHRHGKGLFYYQCTYTGTCTQITEFLLYIKPICSFTQCRQYMSSICTTVVTKTIREKPKPYICLSSAWLSRSPLLNFLPHFYWLNGRHPKFLTPLKFYLSLSLVTRR